MSKSPAKNAQNLHIHDCQMCRPHINCSYECLFIGTEAEMKQTQRSTHPWIFSLYSRGMRAPHPADRSPRKDGIPPRSSSASFLPQTQRVIVSKLSPPKFIQDFLMRVFFILYNQTGWESICRGISRGIWFFFFPRHP